MPETPPKSYELASLRPWALFLLLFIFALLFQGSRGLYNRDETRYAEVAREMLLTKDWVIPHRGLRVHLTKPPFTYWALATSMRLFGVNEWGARVPNALAFALTALLCGLIAEALWGRREGLWAALIYATTLTPFVAGNIVTTDTLLVFWETLGVFALVKGLKNRGLQAQKWFVLLWAAWGMAFFTKGPALAPVALAFVLFYFLNRPLFSVFPLPFLGLVLFLWLGGWWYAYVCIFRPEAFSFLLEEQILGRVAGHFQNSAWYAPSYLYLPLVTLGALIWSTFWARKPRAALSFFQGLRTDWRRELVIFWFLVPLLAFSMARSRLPLYILPCFPPLAVATARFFTANYRFSAGIRKLLLGWFFFLLVSKALWSQAVVPQDARRYETLAKPLWGNGACILSLDPARADGLAFYTQSPWLRVKGLSEFHPHRLEKLLNGPYTRRCRTWVFMVRDEDLKRHPGLRPEAPSVHLPIKATLFKLSREELLKLAASRRKH